MDSHKKQQGHRSTNHDQKHSKLKSILNAKLSNCDNPDILVGAKTNWPENISGAISNGIEL
jgi:hypothetical protein